ncbi:Asp-tRNA(Asn)/Glu-tRNA(Gln) amidotransferase subunit GatA [Candidatus Saccharibacteria bacterium]|nr:Asp-tRNA(Asn)/Glu-tRNA(Gln) amidotransferase subunit GatA [Candidatus Saccharibacteria bacterium]
MSWPSIDEIAASVQSGQTSAEGNVKQALQEVEKHKDFAAIISVPMERALKRAEEIDGRIKQGERVGRLAGVPFIAKDNFLTFGGRTTAASNMLKEFEAPYQATAIEKLELEGAICVAKANLDAWAHGSSTENSDFFTTKNPHDKTRVPGGSSGGSAAAVALDIVPFALGTDTGGSVRLPASFCGVVGYKPTYGLISRSGIVAMASSTDVVGPLTRNIADAALVMDVMSGKDAMDSTTIEKDSNGYEIRNPKSEIRKAKIGVIKEYMGEGLEPGVRTVIDQAIKKLEKAGANISEVSLPSLSLALAVYYIVCPAEVSSNLARYDGQRYGHTARETKNLEDSYFLSRQQGFGTEAKRRIMIGTHVLSSGYYDAYYKKAQKVRTKIINEFAKAFQLYDFLLGPTAPTVAFKIGAKTGNPLQMYLSDILLVAANVSGNPAISIPAGQSQGLPVGLQIIAPQRADKQLLEIAKAFEELN